MTVLMTGFPGFLGSALLPRIVQRTDSSAICLVQPKFSALAKQRVDQLSAAEPALRGRIQVAEGDITQPGLGLGADALNDVTEAWHLAAVYDLAVSREVGHRVNVEGTRNVLDVAVNVARETGLHRFVFTSSYATVGRRHGHAATENDQIDRRRLTPYVESRLQAEDLVLGYAKEHGLPAVAMCVSTTYGSGDWGRTPHGAFIAGAVFGKLPFLMNGIHLEAVGVDDAARALILAAERGRNGERYLISEQLIALREVVRIAADEAGVPPPRRSIPVPALYALGALGTLRARFTGKDAELSLASVWMMRAEAPVDHSKAVRELGWQPRPVEESIREAARFWAQLKSARRKSGTPG